MNRRQIINNLLHDHIEVNKHEDYTDYKKLITAIEEWHASEIKKLTIPDVNNCNYKEKYDKCINVIKLFDAGIIGMYDL